MASINKLSIRGVRAFSPDDEEQVIGFCFPLTIIVGANGCGKTTIIESLKYAVTGSLPPGNKSGQAFVHDPRSVGQSVVKGNIKLRFTNRAGHSMVVVRSMEVTQKKTTMSFKALDGILRTTDPQTGERVSMSHKCTELDRQIPTLMGVSKPILEHVVFCHQEDSSWPLMEGAVLKKRFDDIFDSTRYAKALEAIRNTKKEYASVVKDHKAELNGLASHKHAAVGLREDMDKTRDSLSQIQDDIQHHNDEIAKQNVIIEKYNDTQGEVEDAREKVDIKAAQVDREETRLVTHKSMLDEDMTSTHTQKQLEGMLEEFHNTVADDVKRKDELEQYEEDLKKDVEALRKEEIIYKEQKGKLMGERQSYENDMKERMGLMEEIAAKHKIELTMTQTQGGASSAMGTQQTYTYGSSRVSLGANTTATGGDTTVDTCNMTVSAEDMEVFERALKSKEDDLRDGLKTFKEKSRAEEDEVQSLLNKLMGKQQHVEADREKLNKQKREAQQELQTIASQSSGRSRLHKNDIEDAKKGAARYARERDSANSDPRIKQIPIEISKISERMRTIQNELEEEKATLTQLRRCSDIQNEISMLERQKEGDEEGLMDAITENSFLLQKFDAYPNLGDGTDNCVNITETLADDIRIKHEKAQDESDRASENVARLEREVGEKNALLSHNQRSYEGLKAQKAALCADDRGVQKVRRVISAVRNFEQHQLDTGVATVHADMGAQELLEHLTKRIGEFSAEDTPESIGRTMKKLKKMSKIKGSDGRTIDIICPCCARSMNTDEVMVFDRRMEGLSDPASSELIQADQVSAGQNRSALRNYENWRKIVSQCMPDYLDYARIAKEVDELEVSVADGEDELKPLQNELSNAKEKADELQTDSSELRQLLDIVNRLRDDANRISNKARQISSKRDELSVMAPSAEGRDLETLEREYDSKNNEKDELMKKNTKLNKDLTALNHRILTLGSQATKAEQHAKELEERHKKYQEAAVRKIELNESIAKFTEEDKKLQEQVAPIRQEIRAKQSNRERMRALATDEENRLNNLINEFGNDMQSLNSLSERIDRYLESNKEQELEELDSSLADVAKATNEKEVALKEMAPELEALQKKVGDQERHKKTIEDNIKLIKAHDDVQKLRDELAVMEQVLESLQDSNTLNDDYEAAMSLKKQHVEERARCEGRRMGLKDQQRHLKRKLMTAEYKDIDERHRVKMIEYETTMIAVSDLDKYHSALDKALLRYHGMKIEDINKIIRELWTLTYKGQDITNIALVSGADTSTNRAARSYNYRVVMTKGNAQLDMRGRCSAGQRVLASIVIRLALAETFCLNCGVMALDEPTTNLDYENKRGLAIALAQIIATRATQHNFQLVCITHDEEFVSMMKNELSTHTGFDMPEKYYQVSREEGPDGKHYSKINAIDWDEI